MPTTNNHQATHSQPPIGMHADWSNDDAPNKAPE
jgi:hypothetical protein